MLLSFGLEAQNHTPDTEVLDRHTAKETWDSLFPQTFFHPHPILFEPPPPNLLQRLEESSSKEGDFLLSKNTFREPSWTYSKENILVLIGTQTQTPE